MAAFIPLNTFKTVTLHVPAVTQNDLNNTAIPGAILYTAPRGVTSIILLAQASNLDTNGQTFGITVVHFRPNPLNTSAAWNDVNAGITKTYILNNSSVPPNDSLLILPGKLVLQTYDRLYVYTDTANKIDVVCSILETANG